MKAEQYLEEASNTDYRAIAISIIFELMDGETFTADDFYEKARGFRMPPNEIRRLRKLLFVEFEKTGYIKRSGEVWKTV